MSAVGGMSLAEMGSIASMETLQEEAVGDAEASEIHGKQISFDA